MKYCAIHLANVKKEVPAVGAFQVYDNITDKPLATLKDPLDLCQECVDFAKQCGMRPEEVKDV